MEIETCDGLKKPAPYLRVCSSDINEIHKIIEELKRAGVREDVEYLVLAGFISAKDMG